MENEVIKIDSCADLTMEEGQELIGKEIHSIVSQEYELKLTFTDGSELSIMGAMWGDCSLGIEYTKKEDL